MTEPLEVLYEDAHVVAVAKPAGLLTQGTATGEATLEDALRRWLRPADPGSVYLGTVHRLDRPVSGVIVWARTPRAARRLAAQFAGRTTRKLYWAVVEPLAPADPPAPGETGVWDDHLTDPAGPRGAVTVVGGATPGARRAVTRFERPRPDDPGSLQVPEWAVALWLRPETGRTHQLRAQASARRLPVWGDTLYGSPRSFPAGIALHARSLTFEHPALHRVMTVTAPLPAAWREAGVVAGDP